MHLLPQSISSLDLLSQLNDAVIAIDLEGRILFWNQGAVRLYGWTETEALGQSAHELLNTRSAEPIEPLVDLLLREGRWEGELTRHSRSGEPIDVLSRWSLIRDAEGSPVARFLIDTDLTETRLRFHELRITEERAREAATAAANRESLLVCLLDGISDRAYLKDAEGRYVAVNTATAAFFQKTQEGMLGKTDFELFSSQKALEIVAQDKQLLASGQPVSIEEEVPSASGTEFFHTIKSLCRDRNGQVIGIAGLSRSIGERKQLEAALQQRERELNDAQRIAGIGTWRWDRATDIVTWSDEIYRIYGVERGTRPASYAEIKRNPNSPISHQRFIQAFERAFLFGEPYALDLEIARPDGTTRWLIARGEPDTWQEGSVTSLRGTVIEITERKRLELELSERERQLTEANRIARIGTWRWFRKADITHWSAETFRLFGLDPAAGAPSFDHILRLHAPASARRIQAAVERALRFGESYECDIELILDDGSVRWISARGEVESREEDEVAILRGTVHDITERKRNEDQIALSENRYRSLAHASAQIVWVSNTEGEQMGRIPEWQAFTGQSSLEVLGYGWADAIHPEDREATVNAWLEATRNDTTFTLEQRLRRHDGIYRHMSIRAVPVHDPAGKIVEWVGTHTDITEQKTAEVELREREQRFRLLAESLPELVWVTDPVGSLTYLNTRFLDYCGIAAERMVGFEWSAILHPEEAGAVLERWTHTVQTGEPYLIELRMRAQDGSFRYFLARALPMRNEAGEILRWVGSCTDVHDQKLAEEALRRSEKLAATGRLAASIAHEINNPLSSVTNSLYLALQDPNLSEETRGFLQLAEQELTRVTHITTQTLRFHRQAKAATVADLSSTMASVLMLFGPRLMARKIEVIRDLQPGAEILCFDDELRQVFANLVSNSLDAMGERERIRIRVRRSFGGIRITVADTGCGIPENVRKRIFEPFFSTKDNTGIGLGLWVSDGIIRKHRGQVTVRSSTLSERHGTAISLFLPPGGVTASS